MRLIGLLILTSMLFSCNSKFEKSKWIQTDDIENYPFRDRMIKDLTSNHKLKGLTYSQLIDLIGKPHGNIQNDSNWISYPIKIKYGGDIDPIYTKYLTFKLSKDSVVIDFKINEWKK
jgi:hypothetical protein